MSTNESTIYWPWKKYIICHLMTSWRLLTDSNIKDYICYFLSHLDNLGDICLTSLSTAVTMRERIWRENVQQVRGDLCRSANPCNIKAAFFLSWRAWHMNGHTNPHIHIAADRLPSKVLGQMHYISWIIEISPPPFILFQIRHALLEKCLLSDESCRSFPELTTKTIPTILWYISLLY